MRFTRRSWPLRVSRNCREEETSSRGRYLWVKVCCKVTHGSGAESGGFRLPTSNLAQGNHFHFSKEHSNTGGLHIFNNTVGFADLKWRKGARRIFR